MMDAWTRRKFIAALCALPAAKTLGIPCLEDPGELKGYSGFSASPYLQQADWMKDRGMMDISMTMWVGGNSSECTLILHYTVHQFSKRTHSL